MATARELPQCFATTVDVWATGVALRRQALRRANSELSETDIERRLGERLQERPGAEFVDGPQPIAR